MSANALLNILLRLTVAYAVLVVLALGFGKDYVSMWLNPYRVVITFLAPQYSVMDLHIDDSRHEPVVKLEVISACEIHVGTKTVPKGLSLDASTLIGHSIQHPIIMFTILLAWSGFVFIERIFLVIFGGVFLAAIEMLDVPLVLLGSLEDLTLYYLAPDKLSGSLMVLWMNFLNQGGRLAISVFSAVLCVVTFRCIRDRYTGQVANAKRCAEHA
jgi:hypothetical protein